MNFFTSTLTSGSITIATANGVSQLTVAPRTGSSCEILGNMTFQGNQSTAIPIAEGETFVISAASPSSPIDGFTISWVSGGIDIMMGF
tara:strand:- start:245 stop:508 length:264 start_codon:yes stop_codon:yes gene_type:complete